MWTEKWKTGCTSESVQEAGGTFHPHWCIRWRRVANLGFTICKRVTKHLRGKKLSFLQWIQWKRCCHHWLNLSFSLWSFSLLELLSSVPASVKTFPALFSYLLPLMCRTDSDRLITRYPNSNQISMANRLFAVFRGSYEIPCFDERNKRTAELQVCGADGMIDVFVWSFSVPNGWVATHHTAGSILLPTRRLLHAEFCSVLYIHP